MLQLLQAIPFSFGALFPVVNPIGSSFIVLAFVSGSSHEQLKVLARKIALYTFVMLTVVLFTGSWILRIFGITIPIVLIGGGLVLAYIGWQLLNQPNSTADKTVSDTGKHNLNEMIFYPLTMPITAGPGCIAVAIALGAHSIQPSLATSFSILIGNAIGILLVAITIFFCYRYAYIILNKLGTSGAPVIMRLAAFINLCIGLELIWHGLSMLIHVNNAIVN